jgi:DNA polymerase-3 subunit epsilon
MEQMYLIFDTETAGLPRRGQIPYISVRSWPRLVQIAWVVCDDSQTILEKKSTLVKPEGFTIGQTSAQVHGITTERAKKEGADLYSVLLDFSRAIARSTVAVAHNITFDKHVIEAECIRCGLDLPFRWTHNVCTMESSRKVCGIKRNGRYKWPTLAELHMALFGADYKGHHNAEHDVAACARCFFELRRRGILKV